MLDYGIDITDRERGLDVYVTFCTVKSYYRSR